MDSQYLKFCVAGNRVLIATIYCWDPMEHMGSFKVNFKHKVQLWNLLVCKDTFQLESDN